MHNGQQHGGDFPMFQSNLWSKGLATWEALSRRFFPVCKNVIYDQALKFDYNTKPVVHEFDMTFINERHNLTWGNPIICINYLI